MKSRVLLIPIVAFAFVGCSDDKSQTNNTTADASADTSANTSTGTDAVTTTAQPTTTIVDEVAVRVAAAEELAGTYAGEWNNTTFASSGSIDATFAVDSATAIATMTLSLGGNVFGSAHPDPLTANFDLNAEGPYSGTNDLFGDFTIIYSGGHLSFEAPAVPGVGGKKMTLEGDFTDGSFSGTYTIVELAEGTFEATRRV